MVSRIFGAVWDMLISRNLAVVLLIAVTLMLAVGAVLPNPQLLSEEEIVDMKGRYPLIYALGERYNSQALAKNYFFGAVGIFLIVSTAVCSLDRLLLRYRARISTGIPARPSTENTIKRLFMDTDITVLERYARDWFRGRRWNVTVQKADERTDVIATRGRAGFWGSILFHSVLITALLGMVIYYLGGYRAVLSFTEGQIYPLERDNLVSIQKEPVWGLRLPDVSLGLLKQYSIYDEKDPWYPLDYVARFRIEEKSSGISWEEDVRINDPLFVGGIKFLLVKGGFSPKIVIRDRHGADVFNSFVALARESGTRDNFHVKDERLIIRAKLYPDYIERDGSPDTKSPSALNPFLSLKVFSKGKYIFDGLIPYGSGVRAGDYRISFPEVRKWVHMEMVDEPGVGFFFIISFVGLVGVAVRFIDPDESFYLSFAQEGGSVNMYVTPHSRHFPGLITARAEEFVRSISERSPGEKPPTD
jgi:cytochrome c biogenesis protein